MRARHVHDPGRRRVLTETTNPGVRDVLMLVCDGLKGLLDSVNLR